MRNAVRNMNGFRARRQRDQNEYNPDRQKSRGVSDAPAYAEKEGFPAIHICTECRQSRKVVGACQDMYDAERLEIRISERKWNDQERLGQ